MSDSVAGDRDAFDEEFAAASSLAAFRSHHRGDYRTELEKAVNVDPEDENRATYHIFEKGDYRVLPADREKLDFTI